MGLLRELERDAVEKLVTYFRDLFSCHIFAVHIVVHGVPKIT